MEEKDIYFKENNDFELLNLEDYKDIKELIKLKQKKDKKLLLQCSGKTPRNVVEKSIPDLIYGSEFHKEKDYGHQPNSGMDYVIMKMMSEKGISYGFCITDIKKEINKGNLKVIPRIKQNYMLANKYGVNITIFSGNEKFPLNSRKSIIESIVK